jgi:ATP-dependent Clp protease protease subunit
MVTAPLAWDKHLVNGHTDGRGGADPEANHTQEPRLLMAEELTNELLSARTVLLFGEITMPLAQTVCAQLLMLARRSSDPVRLVINSPGGHVESADTIFDVIRFIAPEVRVLGTGWVVSAAALVYAATKRERRFALSNTRFMLHQPLGGVGGPASDVEIEAMQILAMRERLNHVFADATGQSFERIARDTDRNHWMSAAEAVAYGLVGCIIERECDW